MNIGLFEVTKTNGEALANNLTNLLDQYGFKNHYYICEK
jgi:hypothetical protein